LENRYQEKGAGREAGHYASQVEEDELEVTGMFQLVRDKAWKSRAVPFGNPGSGIMRAYELVVGPHF
jgi:hypothetical protein